MTAERMDNIVAGIQRGEGTASKLVHDDQLYNNINQLSSETVKLLYDFRQNPKRQSWNSSGLTSTGD